MSIITEIEALQQNLHDIKAAIVQKGGTVTDSGFKGLVNEIAQFPDIESFGTLVFKDANENLISITITDETDLDKMCLGDDHRTIELGGYTFLNDDIISFVGGSSLRTLPEGFLRYAQNIEIFDLSNSPIQTISDYCMAYGGWQLSTLILNDDITTIGTYCFARFGKMHGKTFKFPTSLTSFGTGSFGTIIANMTFDVGNLPITIFPQWTDTLFTAMSASDPAYTIGVTIKGANRAAWITALPNSDSAPRRKLLDGGE